MNGSILLVDDDLALLRTVGEFFERKGLEVLRAASAGEALEVFEGCRPDVVLLDLDLPDASGLAVLGELQVENAAVIMLTGHGDIPTAVQAMQAGAENFLTKPVDFEHLTAVVARALEMVRLRRAYDYERKKGSGSLLEALGASPQMGDLARQIERVAEAAHTTVLLTGESGVGKGWLAERIHRLSPRRGGAFVEINCATLTGTLLESELFGHEKGAFTDAKQLKRGLFEIAGGGTIFLDEICDLDLNLQPKLLHVLESHTFRRLGGVREIEVDVRVVAATNRDLEAAVAQNRFREDLFYRLNVMPIRVPALRDRSRSDIVELTQRLFGELCREFPGGPTRIATAAMNLLVGYAWPGNVRELRNALERARIVAGDALEVEPRHLAAEIRRANVDRSGVPLVSLRELERRHIERVLTQLAGNRTRAAEVLGVSRTTLHSKIQKYGLGERIRRPT